MVNEPGRQTEQAVEVFNELQRHGADLSKPRNTRHYFYDGDFRALGEALEKLGFDVSSSAEDHGVIAERVDILNEDWRVVTLTQLSELANQFGSEYDGWEAAMTTQAAN